MDQAHPGVSNSKRIADSEIFLMGVLCWCKSGNLCANAVSAFDSFARSTSQMPAHLRSSATSLLYLLLKSVSAEISCLELEKGCC